MTMDKHDKELFSLLQGKWPPRQRSNAVPEGAVPDGADHAELDPRVIKAGFDLTGYYIETGRRSFTDYARKMIEEYGGGVRPYLKSWYLAVRYYPGVNPNGMDCPARIDEILASQDGCN